jgi:hypothetical protein
VIDEETRRDAVDAQIIRGERRQTQHVEQAHGFTLCAAFEHHWGAITPYGDHDLGRGGIASRVPGRGFDRVLIDLDTGRCRERRHLDEP